MKSQSERLDECVRIASQLRDLGVYVETYEPYIKEPMRAFVRDGVSASQSIYVENLGRVLAYQFSNRSESFVALRSPS
jgi:hypothetical protein